VWGAHGTGAPNQREKAPIGILGNAGLMAGDESASLELNARIGVQIMYRHEQAASGRFCLQGLFLRLSAENRQS